MGLAVGLNLPAREVRSDDHNFAGGQTGLTMNGENTTMRRLVRMLMVGAVIVVAIGLLAAATYIKYVAILLWPGFLKMDSIYSHLGFDGIAFEHFGWIFWPALLINIVLYGLLYLLFRKAIVWKQKRDKPG